MKKVLQILTVVSASFGLFITCIWILKTTHTALAGFAIIYVHTDATGAGTGLNWTDAFTEVQEALAMAEPGDEIWVGTGVYYPDYDPVSQSYTGYLSATFALTNEVSLYGGFAGDETSREQRDWLVNVTVLSGDLDRNDLTDPQGVITDATFIVGSNAWTIVTSSAVTDTAVLDGFTITGGNANDPFCGEIGCAASYGGGMNNNNGSPSLSNLHFSGNAAISGGGMANYSDSDPTLTNAIFSGNTSSGGGGAMFNYSSSPSLRQVAFNNNMTDGDGGGMHNVNTSSPILDHVVFNNNIASAFGGGMANDSYGVSSTPVLSNVSFNNNVAGGGGGMSSGNNSVPTLTHVTFNGNSASNGGGLLVYSISPTLNYITFTNNLAVYSGGGMAASSSNLTLTHAIFINNASEADGGGMYNTYDTISTLVDVIFSGNRALNNGGGILNSESPMTLINARFDSNSANMSGGGLANLSGSSVEMVNATFWNNIANEFGGGIYNYYSVIVTPTIKNSILWNNMALTGTQIYNVNSVPFISFSDIEGSGGSGGAWDVLLGIDGGGNLDIDPLFVDAANGDLRLDINSPAVDAGNNEAVPPEIITDLDENTRFVDVPTTPDTGNGTPPLVDIGAYETIAQYILYLPYVNR